MTLYSDVMDPLGHAVRIVLAEKDINVEVTFTDVDSRPEHLLDLNPYNKVLTLIDRDLVLYEPQIIMEYLDERFPHPPLMPVDPVSRASNRQLRYRVLTDLFSQLDDLEGDNDIAVANARKYIRDNLTALAPAFTQHPFFISDEFSLVDCMLAPLLWRLDIYGIRLPVQAKPVLEFAERIFERESFVSSLSNEEKEMRKA